MMRIIAATTTLGMYSSTLIKNADTSCRPRISVAANKVTINRNHLNISPTKRGIFSDRPACSTAVFNPLMFSKAVLIRMITSTRSIKRPTATAIAQPTKNTIKAAIKLGMKEINCIHSSVREFTTASVQFVTLVVAIFFFHTSSQLNLKETKYTFMLA